MNSASLLARLGFDNVRFGFVLRTGIAACLAIALAWWLGLEHPQWAGMTVWASSQPSRGQLLAKGMARLVGTLIGALVGILLVYLSIGHIGWLVLGLSLWIATCVFTAHLVRSFVTYGCMLAGYSAALVALVDTAHHDQILTLGLDRMFTAVAGVLVAIGVSWFFAHGSARNSDQQELRGITTGILRQLSARVVSGVETSTVERDQLIARLAALDAALDTRGIGSARARQQMRRVRLLLLVLVSIVIWTRKTHDSELGLALAQALKEAAVALEAGDGDGYRSALNCAIERCAGEHHFARLHYNLTRLLAMTPVMEAGDAPSTKDESDSSLPLHRDWTGARQSGIRALTLMMTVGAVWLFSGAQIGAYMLLGTAVMTSLFSTFDSPVHTMRSVFIGQVMGAVAALICRWLIWPQVDSEWMLIVSMFPFIMLGVVVFAHRKLVFAGMDYNMVLLLLLQPHYPLVGEVGHSLLMAVAVASAPLIAMAGYWLIYPVNAAKRIELMRRMMLHELRDMTMKPTSGASRERWRLRLYHRLLHLVRWSGQVGDRRFPAEEWGVMLLRLEMTTETLRALLDGKRPISDSTKRAVEYALRRLEQLEHKPERVLRALRVVSVRMAREPDQTEELVFALAADKLQENLALFTLRR
ncbi:MAG: FUSC family protein [Oceanospirillales bacterium]|nr:FUSC family protein [Oceanospirillales bacterium]